MPDQLEDFDLLYPIPYSLHTQVQDDYTMPTGVYLLQPIPHSLQTQFQDDYAISSQRKRFTSLS